MLKESLNSAIEKADSENVRIIFEEVNNLDVEDEIEIYNIAKIILDRKTVLDKLEKIGTDYPKLEQINLVASIPSCLSVEIGRMVAQNNNRVKKIVSYHFESQSEKLYPFGIVITESRGQYEKGAFVEN